jgi:uncharacterized protein (TIGR00369 family)
MEAPLTGFETMQAILDGRAPRPGIAGLLGMRLVEVGEGRAAFEVNTRPDFANPLGTVHGGIAATLLDSAMGCAVHTTLPAGDGYTTVDLAVTYLRAVPFDGVALRAEGEVIHVGGRVATAEGRLVDDEGRLVATATTTCMVFRGGR